MSDLDALAEKPETDGTYDAPPHGWVCFHCGEEFSVAKQKSWQAAIEAATEHFGPDPRWNPVCVDAKTLSKRTMARDLRRAEREALRAFEARNEAQEEAEGLAGELAAIGRLFPGARSPQDAWNIYESMEGRAIAAEAILAAVEKIAPEAVARAREEVCGSVACDHGTIGYCETCALVDPGELGETRPMAL